MFGFRYLEKVVTLELAVARCTGCGACLEVCPHAVFELADGTIRIADRDACMECGACARNCPEDALRVRAGVGCALAVMNAALGRDSSACCCAAPDGDGSAGCCDTGYGGEAGNPAQQKSEGARDA